MSVAIVDSGGANIGSVRYAFERLGIAAQLTADPDRIAQASHVLLPGVGAAKPAMDKLKSNRLDELIPTLRQPVLGICLGLQLMFAELDEGGVPGLGLFAGTVDAFTPAPGRRVPHMGWAALQHQSGHALLAGIPDGAFAYFVHSYRAPVGEYTLAGADHGGHFSAIVARGNFMAAQFHPERSAQVGARLLKNFVGL